MSLVFENINVEKTVNEVKVLLQSEKDLSPALKASL
ncbi:hypothetical protein MNBD_GAMMA01-1402, partial [hydrothermal vent metagenome]